MSLYSLTLETTLCLSSLQNTHPDSKPKMLKKRMDGQRVFTLVYVELVVRMRT